MSRQQAQARVPLCPAFVEIHQEEPTQSFATKSDKSGKFSGVKFENCSFNIRIVNCPVTKKVSRSYTSRNCQELTLFKGSHFVLASAFTHLKVPLLASEFKCKQLWTGANKPKKERDKYP